MLTPYSGTTTVTTSGTAVPLTSGAHNQAGMVVIQAKSTNTNPVFIGDSTVLAATPTGIRLEAKQTLTLNAVDSSKLYVDATTNGEGVTWLVLASS